MTITTSKRYHGLSAESYWWAYDLGMKAYDPDLRKARRTTRLKRCVFRADTLQYQAWEDGWYDAANIIQLSR